MKCPNCDAPVIVEDPSENQTFSAPCCGAMLRYEVDESTCFGATHQVLTLLDDDEGEE